MRFAAQLFARGVLAPTGFFFFYLGGLLLSWVLLPALLVPVLSDRRRRTDRSLAVVSSAWRLFHWYMRVLRLFHHAPGDVDLELPDEPCVVVANHPTLVDVTALLSAHWRMHCVVKRVLFRSPLVGPLLWLCDHIPGGREGPAATRAVMEGALARLRAGWPVLLFPEGTRSPPGSLHPLKRGAFEIASRADVPVVPLLLRCEPPVLSKQFRWYQVPATTPRFTVTRLPTLHPSQWDGDSRAMAREVETQYRRLLFGPPAGDREGRGGMTDEKTDEKIDDG